MPGAMDFFLTYQLQRPEHHPNGWEWWVLDREGIHQDLLQLLLQESPEFAEAIVGHSGQCIRQPAGGIFDLRVASSAGQEAYLEIKTDQKWSQSQRDRQVAFIRTRDSARAFAILLSQRAVDHPTSSIELQTSGVFTKISYSALCSALERINSRPELRELASAYISALRKQEKRTIDLFGGDPNL